jgi:hypothetical protein
MSLLDLQIQILSDLASGHNLMEETTTEVVQLLYEINLLGLITFESQPHRVISNVNFTQRSFVNGIYPTGLVPYLVETLHQLHPEMIISETQLNLNGTSSLKVYGDISGVPLSYGLYPMFMNAQGEYIEGMSGDVTEPSGDINIYLERFPNLKQQVFKRMSLIQIWSSQWDANVMTIMIESLKPLFNHAIAQLFF